MGNLFSRKQSPATELERVALTIDELKRRLQTISTSNSNTLYYYYMSIIVALSIVMAHTWLRFDAPTRTYVACALVFGAAVVVLAGRYVINGIYAWRTNRTTQKLETALSQKETLLDLVKETLKFKEAKEILDRYEKNNQEKPIEREVSQVPQPLVTQKPQSDSPTPSTPKLEQKGVPATPSDQGFKPNTAMTTQGMSPYHQRYPNAAPVRPFLRQTTALDRVLDYFMSDGPNCRNALICSICHTHNGMAMPAEYPYIAFRCFECGHLNPAKKMGQQVPVTRPPGGPMGIQHSGRAPPNQNLNGKNVVLTSADDKSDEKTKTSLDNEQNKTDSATEKEEKS